MFGTTIWKNTFGHEAPSPRAASASVSMSMARRLASIDRYA